MAGKLASLLGGGINGISRGHLGLATDDDVTFGTITAGGATLTGLTAIDGTVTHSVTIGITADSNDDQANAVALTTTINKVSAGGANDAVKLLTASAGLMQIIMNTTGSTINVFPNTSDKIDDGSANAATTVADGVLAMFFAVDGENWYKWEG